MQLDLILNHEFFEKNDEAYFYIYKVISKNKII